MNKFFEMALVAMVMVCLHGCATPTDRDHPNQKNIVAAKVHVDALGLGATMGGDVHTSGGGQGQQVIMVPAQPGYGGQQPINLGGGYIQQRPPMYGGGMQGGLFVGECSKTGVTTINNFVDFAVSPQERTSGYKDASGDMTDGVVRCYFVKKSHVDQPPAQFPR